MNIFWRSISVLALIALSACMGGAKSPTSTPVDTAAIFTAAAQTVSAQMTQTVAAMPPPTETPTPQSTATLAATPALPAETSALSMPPPTVPLLQPSILTTSPPLSLATTSGALCDNAIFIADITIKDGTKMKPGEQFKKIWRIQNTGVCTWDDGYSLVYSYGDGRLGGGGFSINSEKEFTSPGEVLDVGMMMVAPNKPGVYGSCWQMRNDRGVVFGTPLCVNIEVVK